MTPEPTPPKKAVNKLTMPQTVRLLDWLRSHEADARIQPDTKLAARASVDLEFGVTHSNLTSAREAAGLHKIEQPKPLTLEERVAHLEKQSAAQMEILARISQALDLKNILPVNPVPGAVESYLIDEPTTPDTPPLFTHGV